MESGEINTVNKSIRGLKIKNFLLQNILLFLTSQYLTFYLKNPQYFFVSDEVDHACFCDFTDAFKQQAFSWFPIFFKKNVYSLCFMEMLQICFSRFTQKFFCRNVDSLVYWTSSANHLTNMLLIFTQRMPPWSTLQVQTAFHYRPNTWLNGHPLPAYPHHWLTMKDP